jgi:hypothetical protein
MCSRNHCFAGLSILLLSFLLLTVTPPALVYADELPPIASQGKCVNCHENLYFLHDTGKWFCLRDSPMACVDCHGGNPNAITKDTAHADRASHPILNENIAKCQECHPEVSSERVQIFRDVAGVGPVKVAAAYVPAVNTSESHVALAVGQKEPFANRVLPLTILFFVVMLLVLGVIFAARYQCRRERS